MKVRWTKLFWRTVVWLSAEVALTLLGVDDLADYSEFIFLSPKRCPIIRSFYSPHHFSLMSYPSSPDSTLNSPLEVINCDV